MKMHILRNVDSALSILPLSAVVLVLAGCAGHTTDEAEVRKEDESVQEHRSGKWSPELSKKEKATLFSIAEDTLKWCVVQGNEKLSFDSYSLTGKLEKETATFVTLKTKGRLRGCIGSLMPVAPLYRSVHDNAINAALRDHRFRPVTPMEVDQIDIHISILSPIRTIASPEEFKIGEHGIIIEKGRYRAVYLPEVAVEQNWTKEETLSSLSMKAGMRGDAWKEGAQFKVFSSVALSKY